MTHKPKIKSKIKSKREKDNFRLKEAKPRQRKKIILTLKIFCQLNHTKLFSFEESERVKTRNQRKLMKKSKFKYEKSKLAIIIVVLSCPNFI